MTVQIPFDNSFARLGSDFSTSVLPTPVGAPKLVAFNEPLAQSLGLSWAAGPERGEVFAGNQMPEGAEPLAQLYSGHQFGQYNPQLGDGRAILLGEVIDHNGIRQDLQLKGAGRTPYSRGGDGRAWLGPVLREYLVSEAMHALGVPTTRALAAVTTGEPVYRERALPGAVLTRVAQSHLRVGTFQVFAARGQTEALEQLTEYAIARHYPEAEGPMGLLREVCEAQAELVAAWMSFGFIHGVMNTDNCSISGETIDYGPCAFMDVFDHNRVFSSIDRMGRYAYANQPSIAAWNMAQLATSLIQMAEDPNDWIEEATEIVHGMPSLLQAAWMRRFRAKLGLTASEEGDLELITDLLRIMAEGQADFTNTFRALADGDARDQFLEPAQFDDWGQRWLRRVEGEEDPQAVMRAANPVLIPRNHRIEALISEAVDGDFSAFHRLHTALAEPFEAKSEFDDLRRPPSDSEVVQATFCGT
ncbi:MAG: YdiU family protein [Epibacterium sp.]|nr:YdiU family protein [Epibacterium sp.]NQX75166.1 YdiU family protein [Epibacterium sp.]